MNKTIEYGEIPFEMVNKGTIYHKPLNLKRYGLKNNELRENIDYIKFNVN